MADTKISAMTLATAPTGTDVFPLVRSASNYRATLTALKAYILGTGTEGQILTYKGGTWVWDVADSASNTRVGYLAGASIVGGSGNNTIMGSSAYYAATSGGYNTALGVYALATDTAPTHCVAVGYQALRYAADASNSIAIGSNALSNITSTDSTVAIGNGAVALSGEVYTSVIIGAGAIPSAENGMVDTVAIGASSMHDATSSAKNTAVGSESLYKSTSGSYNTAVGFEALYSLTTGQYSTAVGEEAGFAATGSYNCFIGASSGIANTSGAYNTYLGKSAGSGNTTQSNRVCIGYMAGYYTNTASAFFVDAFDRTNTAGEVANSILYGVMSSSGEASQTLVVNAALKHPYASISNTALEITGSGEQYMASTAREAGQATVELWCLTGSATVETPVIWFYPDGTTRTKYVSGSKRLGSISLAEDLVDGAVVDNATITLDDTTYFTIGDKIRLYDSTNGEQFAYITDKDDTYHYLVLDKTVTVADNANVSEVYIVTGYFHNGWSVGIDSSSAIDSLYYRASETA